MFPYQSCELSFQSSNNLENNTNTSNNYYFHHKVDQHAPTAPPPPITTTTTNLLHQPHNAPNSNLKSSKPRKPRSGKSTVGKEGEISGTDIAKKKDIHREVERQRRQEMSTLHSSLRSLLPMEYIRGKRSVSDHVTEATRYIKDLENNVKELGDKRDKLKESFSSLENQVITKDVGCSSSSSMTSTTSRSSNSNTGDYNVSIHKFSRTLQIEIAAGVEEEGPYPLSRALKVLDKEGLDVVSCVSSKVNQRWIYVIYCEVSDATSVDSSHLQDKLMSVVSSCM